MIHDLGVVIERVRECFRVRPVTVPKTRIVRCYQVIAIGKPREKGLEHPGRGRKPMQQQERWRVFRPGLSVKDGKPTYLYRAIKSRMFHGEFLSLRGGRKLKYSEHHRNCQHCTRNLGESVPTGQVKRAHRLPSR